MRWSCLAEQAELCVVLFVLATTEVNVFTRKILQAFVKWCFYDRKWQVFIFPCSFSFITNRWKRQSLRREDCPLLSARVFSHSTHKTHMFLSLALISNVSFCLSVSGQLSSSSRVCSCLQGQERTMRSCWSKQGFIMASFQRNKITANKDLHKDEQHKKAILEFFMLSFLEVDISHAVVSGWGWKLRTVNYLFNCVCACAIILVAWDPQTVITNVCLSANLPHLHTLTLK